LLIYIRCAGNVNERTVVAKLYFSPLMKFYIAEIYLKMSQ